MLHIYWRARSSSNVSLDLIVFPGDASFSHVAESNEDNVFVLNFESSQDKHFVSLATCAVVERWAGSEPGAELSCPDGG